MRLCPLAGGVVVPCPPEQPWCPWCGLQGLGPVPVEMAKPVPKPVPVALVKITPAPTPKPQRACLDCGAVYELRGSNHWRCQSCAVVHTRKKNAAYQRTFRQHHKTEPRSNPIPDVERHYFEMLHADGMTASAIAQELGHSHHTVLKHLARPDAQRRVALLRLDGPEPELPH